MVEMLTISQWKWIGFPPQGTIIGIELETQAIHEERNKTVK